MSRERPSRRPGGPLDGAGRALHGHPGQVHRQPARRRPGAEQHVGQRRPRLGARVPGDQHGVGQLQHRTKLQRPAGHHDDDQRLAQGRPARAAVRAGRPADRRSAGTRSSPLRLGCSPTMATVRSAVSACRTVRSPNRPSETTRLSGPSRSASAAAGLTAESAPPPSTEANTQVPSSAVDVLDERAAQVHDAEVAVQRQDPGVLQQHHRRGRRLPRQGGGRRGGATGPRRARGSASGRSSKQPDPELQPEHPAYGVVQQVDADLPGGDQAGQVLTVGPGHHVQVDAGQHGLAGGVPPVAGHPLVHQLADPVPVADHGPGEAPLVLEQVADQRPIARASVRRRRRGSRPSPRGRRPPRPPGTDAGARCAGCSGRRSGSRSPVRRGSARSRRSAWP